MPSWADLHRHGVTDGQARPWSAARLVAHRVMWRLPGLAPRDRVTAPDLRGLGRASEADPAGNG
jgi:hypothetical protein